MSHFQFDLTAAQTLNEVMRGQTVAIGDLKHANIALRQAQVATAAYSAQAKLEKAAAHAQAMDVLQKADLVGPLANYGAYASGVGTELAPLVPQAISPTLESTTVTAMQARLFRSFAKVPVGSPMFNQSVITSVGNPLFPAFMAEGGAGDVNPKAYNQTAIRSRYAYNKFNVSFVGTITNMVGPYGGAPMVGKNLLETERNAAIDALSVQLNRASYWGDSTVTQNGFDGVIKQITGLACATTGTAAGAWTLPANTPQAQHQGGASLTYQDLTAAAANAADDDRAGAINKFWMSPKMYGSFFNQASTFTRANDITPGSGRPFIFGPSGKLYVPSVYSTATDSTGAAIPGIELAVDETMNLPKYAVTSAASGSAPPNILALTITAAAGSPGAGVTSYFTAAASYEYYVVGVGSAGVSVPAPVPSAGLAQIAVTAGQVVTINVQDAGIQGSGDAQVMYYYLIRSTAGSTTTFTVQHYWPVNAAGTSSGTKIVDNNFFDNATQTVVGVTERPGLYHWVQFLDFMQFPLAMIATSVPVLLLNFGSPAVLAPAQHQVLFGCGVG